RRPPPESRCTTGRQGAGLTDRAPTARNGDETAPVRARQGFFRARRGCPRHRGRERRLGSPGEPAERRRTRRTRKMARAGGLIPKRNVAREGNHDQQKADDTAEEYCEHKYEDRGVTL